uniref:Putative cytochrome n=1 Tax=Nyssomyia neivai TaxID=330878 RepID=A0A1L8E4G3_9DIPT
MTKFTWQRAIMFFSLLFFPGFAKKMKFTFFMSSENTFLRESITTVMSQREKMGIKCNDLIDILISMKNTQQDIFHGDVLVGQAAAFLFAGYETSSSATSFALYLLAKHPDIQARVRREILEELEKTGDITFEGINDLQYLTMVIQETFRMYPSLMVLDRVCVDDNSYSLEPQHSFSIPKGMPVYIPTFAIHRDPNIYQNPEEFDPERFHNISNDLMFLSFGLGPRTCIGGRFAMIQVKMALISILKSYKVECCANTVSKITFDPRSFLMQSKDPINLIFRKL